MQFTVSVKRSGNRNHLMSEQLVYRRDRYWIRSCSLYLLTTATTIQFISVSSGSLFMYAEDTSIFCIGQSADSAIALLNKALGQVDRRCLENRLTPHPGKSEALAKFC